MEADHGARTAHPTSGLAGPVEPHQEVKDLHLRKLFAGDAKRGERMTLEAAGLYLDYSKNRITDETLRLLLDLAEQSGLRDRIEAMFRGDKINVTENRAVLHTALRAPRDAKIMVDGHDVVPDVHRVLDRMADFSERVRKGEWRGHTGKRIRNIVNIGIGGSDLGPDDGLRGAAPLRDARAQSRLRLERRCHRLRPDHARLRPGRDPVHRLLENLHDARDADQRPLGARLVPCGAQ